MNLPIDIYHYFMMFLIYGSFWISITNIFYCVYASLALILNVSLSWKGQTLYNAQERVLPNVVKERLITAIMFLAIAIALTYHSTDIMSFAWRTL